jgi:succinate dehydrogenase/fumarate reductase cytochrome b subunit (b558 family)
MLVSTTVAFPSHSLLVEIASKGQSRASFLLRRLHSVSGALPLGGFLVIHLWTNAAVLAGAEPFRKAVAQIAAIPALPFVEAVFILAPLCFHAIYGIWLARNARPNIASYTYPHHWAYLLQRVTGIMAFAFVIMHLWQFWAQKVFFGMQHEAFYDALVRLMSATQFGVPWYAALYVLGVAATVFHFANGLSTFCITWGLATSPSARSRVTWAASTFGLVLFLLGSSSVVSLATGHRPAIPMSETAPACEP